MNYPIPDPDIVPNDQREDIILACTIWGEARSQADDVRIAKANVMNNRKLAGIFGGHTLKAVCLAPLQFSCWNHNDPNRVKVLEPLKYDKQEVWEGCYMIADLMLRGEITDNTLRSTHYHDFADTFDHRVSWANDPRYKWIMDVGNTHFFRDTKAFIHAPAGVDFDDQIS